MGLILHVAQIKHSSAGRSISTNNTHVLLAAEAEKVPPRSRSFPTYLSYNI